MRGEGGFGAGSNGLAMEGGMLNWQTGAPQISHPVDQDVYPFQQGKDTPAYDTQVMTTRNLRFLSFSLLRASQLTFQLKSITGGTYFELCLRRWTADL
jgi:hypothetical protein